MLTPDEKRLVELAVADAPPLTEEQIVELKRVFRPYVAAAVAEARAREAKERGTRSRVPPDL